MPSADRQRDPSEDSLRGLLEVVCPSGSGTAGEFVEVLGIGKAGTADLSVTDELWWSGWYAGGNLEVFPQLGEPSVEEEEYGGRGASTLYGIYDGPADGGE